MTSRSAFEFEEAFPGSTPESDRPRLEILEGGREDSGDIERPELRVVGDAETVTDEELEKGDQLGRAAAGAGAMIENYVDNPAERPARERRSVDASSKSAKSKSSKAKGKSTPDPDESFKGGGGGQWWREKVREAKATHEDNCNCMFCLSPVI